MVRACGGWWICARVVRAVEAGLSRRAAAAKFEVSISFVVKLMQRWRERGTLQPQRIGGGKRPSLAAHGERAHAILAAEPDLTIAEVRDRLERRGSRRAAPRSASSPRGSREKKSQHAAEPDRADVAAARLAWCARQPALKPEGLVFTGSCSYRA